MTEITFKNVPGYFRLKVEGHAGYGCAMGLPEGHDIVCAAVSAIGQTAAQCMIDLGEEKAVVIQDMQIKAGLIDIRVLVKKKAQKRLNAMVYTIKRGYETLSKSYPEFVHMNAKSGVVEKKK